MRKLSTVLLVMTGLFTPLTANAMESKVQLDQYSLAIVNQYLPAERNTCLNFESVSKDAQKAVRCNGYSDVWYDLCIKGIKAIEYIPYKPLGISLKKAENLNFIAKHIENIRSSIEIIPLKSNIRTQDLQEFNELSRCFAFGGDRFYFLCPRNTNVSNSCKEKAKRKRYAENARNMAFKLYERGYVEKDLDIPDMDIVSLLDYKSIFNPYNSLLDINGKIDEKKLNEIYEKNIEKNIEKNHKENMEKCVTKETFRKVCEIGCQSYKKEMYKIEQTIKDNATNGDKFASIIKDINLGRIRTDISDEEIKAFSEYALSNLDFVAFRDLQNSFITNVKSNLNITANFIKLHEIGKALYISNIDELIMQSQEALLDYYLDENRYFFRIPHFNGMITCFDMLSTRVINNNYSDYEEFILKGTYFYNSVENLSQKRDKLFKKIKNQLLICPRSSNISTIINVVRSEKIISANHMGHKVVYLGSSCQPMIRFPIPINIPINPSQIVEVVQQNEQVAHQDLE